MRTEGSPALQAAVLPFVMPWKTLDPHLEVVSLDGEAALWRQLLAGQGIGLRRGTGAGGLPRGCAVVTGFGALDTEAPETLAQGMAEALRALRPGGLLVLGGGASGPAAGTTPHATARLLEEAGFDRVRVIDPAPPGGDDSLTGALEGSGQGFAVIAQKAARGRAFDIFSTVFAEASLQPRRDRLQRAEAALHHRIDDGLHRAQGILHDRITHAEADLRTRLEAAEAALAEQRILLAELQRLTRRRGLRKLVHRLKQRWRGKAGKTPAPAALTAAAAPSAAAPEHRPATTAPAPAGDPVPLSPREAALRQRLADRADRAAE